ncbi:DUF3189 family protein [Clostridium botulinum]|uniref:DUF3189 family protein n=1 Tax=Clostridium botulinum TaxID=1491 RepID=UPI0013F1211C|nr:DUF3189 family protein [Clostridium botulinum]MBN1059295.1 DUF3189 family protein [Clostridium botulinum]NFH70580.1 DUF3189 family protein [Clostridium botulinum]NFH89684.1 DUF3189 family protein [Clostridium botulinum]NFI16887.1 DUF3189 family protein [Clostridium botulinum]NFL91601.1 DUF3189 family protein [Clostridium botulinum]
MIYIYNCYGGTHSSVLAMAYHLEILDETREPTKDEILNVPNFNKLVHGNRGELFYYGNDKDGNKVYAMGRGNSKILIPGMYNLTSMLHKQNLLNEKIIFSNTSPTVPLPMTIGGMFSRWLKIDFIGVPFLIKGAKKSYKDIVSLVKNTKKVANENNSDVIILDNKEFKKK